MSLLHAMGNVEPWIHKKSVKEVEELNPSLFDIYNFIGQPIFIAFVDFEATDPVKSKS